uniref:Uncharacterized protein n=1 Tax=Glycine max TaxID=3847 RepID=A0A0R0L144_SOYBN
MEHLDFSSNYDSSEMQIPEYIGSFKNLRYLNLSYIGLSGRIPYELGNLLKLEYLDLQENFLDGAIPSQLGNLTSLRYLDLSYNFEIDGEIPCQFRNLSQLQYLDLEGTHLSGAIPFQIGNLPILNTLKLGQNLDVKSMDTMWLSSLYSLTHLGLDSLHNLDSSHHLLQTISKLFANLRELRLVGCSLLDDDIQSLFHSHSNFSTSLVILDLSSNMLTSSTFQLLLNISLNLEELYLSHNNIVLSSPFHSYFPSLVILDLSYNNMTSLVFQVIFHWLFNFTNLQTLHLVGNLLEGSIPDGFGKTGMLPNLTNLPSLRNLNLSYNRLTREIPKSIGLLYELMSLHLEENYLVGDIIESHLTNLTKLEELDLTDNSLSLKFGTTWVPPFQLYVLGLASCTIPNLPMRLTMDYEISVLLNSNKIEGGIPTFLSQVTILDLSKNKISDLNTFLCGKGAATNMLILDLSNNQIMGKLPDCWEHHNSLQVLDLTNNRLSGKIPESMDTLVNLEALILRNNSLIGELPFTLKNCTSLVTFDVSENLLSGPIPSWIGESLQRLKILSL